MIIDLRSRLDHPLGDAVDTFVKREDAERFIEEVQRDDLELARATYGSRSGAGRRWHEA